MIGLADLKLNIDLLILDDTEASDVSTYVAINSAIQAVSLKFTSRISNVAIDLLDHITEYHLSNDYLKRIESNETKYIRDSPDRLFNNDCVTITNIYNELGEELSLNDITDPNTILLTSPDSFYKQNPRTGNSLSVYFSALMDQIPVTDFMEEDFDPATVNLNIPVLFKECIIYYVGHLLVDNKFPVDSQLGQQNNYMKRYLGACSVIQSNNLIPKIGFNYNKFDAKGFK